MRVHAMQAIQDSQEGCVQPLWHKWVGGALDGRGCINAKMELNRDGYPPGSTEMDTGRSTKKIGTYVTRLDSCGFSAALLKDPS
jgi:hypothetical protein